MRHTFAIKRELAAIKRHDLDTTGELETAKDRIRKLSEIVDTTKQPGFDQDDCEPSSYKADIIRQKEEMINCLQDEEKKKLREVIPDNDVASLQEELAAAKLREAEANLALKDLKAKVADLSTMWKKHLQQRSEAEASTGSSTAVPS